jgi:magnesium transporter
MTDRRDSTVPASPTAEAISPYTVPHIEFDLGDHRQQPGSIARNDTSGSRTRRSTFASIHGSGATELLDLPAADRAILQGTIARDFEHAIDDAASIISRNYSIGGGGPRRPTRGESTRSQTESPSPPTSVHAFAEHRRRDRSNTMNTVGTADGRLGVDAAVRPGSISGISRRRLTMDDNATDGTGGDNDSSTDTSAENDVCYPQDEQPADGPVIDFEELEEFVAEAEQTGPQKPDLEKVPTGDDIEPSPAEPTVESDDAFDELEKVRMSGASAQRPGAMPFFTFFAADNEDTIHSTALGGLLSEGETFRQLFSVGSDGGCWWLDVVRPGEEEVSVLCKAFGVHPLTREDIMTQESREKVELFRHYYFVAFQSFGKDPDDVEGYLEPLPVYAVVFREGIITFSHASHGHSKNVLRRISKLRDYMQLSADWICYALIDDIVDSFMPVIHELDGEVDGIEDAVYRVRSEDARRILEGIGSSRRKVMVLLRLLGGKSDVIKGFAKRCNDQFSVAPTGDVGLYLSDIQDHIVTMRDNLSHLEQLLGRTHANFLAQINLDNIESGNATNKLLGKVTLLATILVPMNLVTGLFGMNVDVPGRSSSGITWFMGIVGVMLVFACVCLFCFRRFRLI